MMSAQTLWLDSGRESRLTVELHRPALRQSGNRSISGFTAFCGLHTPIGKQVDFVGILPLAHSGTRYKIFRAEVNESQTAVGNLYAGLRLHAPNYPAIWEIGLHLPTAAERMWALENMLMTEWTDRMETLISQNAFISAIGNIMRGDSAGLLLRFRAGPVLAIGTAAPGNTELFIRYGFKAAFRISPMRIAAGMSGLLWMSQEGSAGVAERTFHQMGISAGMAAGLLQPALLIRIPLDEDLKEAYHYTIGLNLTVKLP